MRAVSFCGLSLALLIGCSGANPSSGQSAWLRVQSAQYVAGGIDLEVRAEEPQVRSVSLQNNEPYPGIAGKSISGALGPGSTAVLLGLLGDSGHWVLPVQDTDPSAPGDFIFSCTASLSPLTQAGDGGGLSLVVRATNREGEMGPAQIQPMILASPRPLGALVIALDWDTHADLDLHVVLPSPAGGANEIWPRKPSGLPLGQANATVEDGMNAGYLDRDSNSQCAIDGVGAENVIFPTVAPSGRYIVRVDTFSLCKAVTARWRLRVFQHGAQEPVRQVFGQSTDTDTRYPHGQGAGVQALVFDNP